jgi:hypothetical protein
VTDLEVVSLPEFTLFKKIPRLYREILITEKIDGTNATIYVAEDGGVAAASRNRWLSLTHDNYGFARWVTDHQIELASELGPGWHRGEWWGQGIQRGYGLKEKRFSLFNTERWGGVPLVLCDVVPVLYRGVFDTNKVEMVLSMLDLLGSQAAPGFMRPEGIVIFHTASEGYFKVTLQDDALPKTIILECGAERVAV